MNIDKAKKYLELARCQADIFSKDQYKKVGALFLMKESYQILTSGYNGMPRGIDETVLERWDRPLKYKYIEHAERNCIYNASRHGVPLNNSICIVTMFPCVDCTRALIQVGISLLVTIHPVFEHPRWGTEHILSSELLEEAGIHVILL
jgi:dCMP deaminase